ncbi:uncharacterized protein LOC131944515 [Physella acuta]|uniref:uncharacterized protein LOC131944515 n=1 Tax=Physella acuta TaxID=109671 RepID=UPI0027DE466E|nr:uncharacterized protein LOC131944515 [Physella acuta]
MENVQVDRRTRKRNIQLQQQLSYRLQLLNEEYRMVKETQEETRQQLAEFLMCLTHKAPGLSSYGHPNTRAMDLKHHTIARRYDLGENGSSQLADTGSSPLKESSKRSTDRSKTPLQRSEPLSRKEFFNRKIMLDSRRHSFLTNSLKSSSENISIKVDTPRPKTQEGRLASVGSTIQTKAGKSRIAKSSSEPRGDRVQKWAVKNKKDEATMRQDAARKSILNQFSIIFDLSQSRVDKSSDSPTREESNASVDSMQQPTFNKPSANLAQKVAWGTREVRHFDCTDLVECLEDSRLSSHSVKTHVSVRQHVFAGGVRPTSTRVCRHRCADEHVSSSHRRPKTAPPNYELKQRAMVAPRQQVAGILAEIQSRRATTRALLHRSKQLNGIVKQLAPPELDESFSD